MSEFGTCAVCERTILRGEQVTDYLDAEGVEVAVCPLCKGRAEAAGWLPAAFAASAAQPRESDHRGGGRLRDRLARASQAAGARLARRPDPAPEPAGEPPSRGPLDVFNASPEAHQVAGLIRSLGEPRVSVRGELITVAWDLSWYQWRIEGERVIEVAKGSELDQLGHDDRAWNAAAAADGSVSLA